VVSIATIATMAVVIVIIVAALGSIAIKKKKNGKRVKELIIFTWKKESRGEVQGSVKLCLNHNILSEEIRKT